MKQLTLLLLLVSAIGHAQDCSNPMTNATFQSGFNIIASQTSNQKKLDKSLEFINKTCLLSSQVKNIAVLFTEDNYRFEFCRVAYQGTFDRVNFFEVYDAFTSFSYALRLYDFTRNPQSAVPVFLPVVENPIVKTNPAAPATLKFADLIYPTTVKYAGNKGCQGPVIDDAKFLTLANQVFNQPTDESKFVAIKGVSQDACLSMAQTMKLTSLIGSEKMRLNTMSEVFHRIYDQDNYLPAKALFSSTEIQNQWVESARFTLNSPPPAPATPACEVSAGSLKTIIGSLQSKNFPAEKLDLLSVIKKDKCFTVAQVKAISQEFPFDKDKVVAMKMLYEKCPDKTNYYTLESELMFGYIKDELTQFIKNDGK